MRGVLSLVVVVAVLGLAAAPATAQAGADSDLEAVRRRANDVAAELAGAQSRLAELELDMARLEAQAADGEARRAALESTVRDLAIDRFMRGAAPTMPVLGGDLNAAVRADALASFVARENLDAVDEFRQAGQDIARAREGLAGSREELAAAAADVEQRVREADSELARLQRLADQRRAAEAVAPPAPSPAAPAPATPGGGTPPAPATPGGGTPPDPDPSPPAGGGGSPAPSVVAESGWACPVQGPLAFSNDWGQPRSGGRRHQGNDILSPRGTPVVANVSGTVRPHQSGLGGISYYLKGDDGTTYFGTHLDSLSGAGGRVAQGEVLGYVGNSGNAAGGPTHLHFEMHPGGGGAVNPYPTLSRYC